MDILVKNTSSPGAMFSKNTDQTMVSAFDWIQNNNSPTLPFKEFRSRLASEYGINDNNARNIYPLLRNCGFVSYEKNGDIDTKLFFTNTGQAYVKLLKTLALIESDTSYTNVQKEEASNKIELIKQNIVYGGLKRLLSMESNYKIPFLNVIKYLLAFSKINKKEFALQIYAYDKYGENFVTSIRDIVEKYRNEVLEINVLVDVRNDIDIREASGNSRRTEGIEYLTSFGYFTGLLLEAGLVYKNKSYFVLSDDNKIKIKNLIKED